MLMRPTIHMNGTSVTSLLADLTGAIDALRLAIAAVERTYPNGRDYYTQGPDAIREAMRQHAARVQSLTTVMQEIYDIAESLV